MSVLELQEDISHNEVQDYQCGQQAGLPLPYVSFIELHNIIRKGFEIGHHPPSVYTQL